MSCKKSSIRVEIHTPTMRTSDAARLYDTTIRQLLSRGCGITIYEYCHGCKNPVVTTIGNVKKYATTTPVARGEVRAKRKYEYDYDVEREMQVQMGALYYLRRRDYDSDGTKGIKVSCKYAAEIVLNFFRDILPVQVKVPCEGGSDGTIIVKESLIGYLRNREEGTAVKDLAKAISRRVKRGRTVVLHSS